MGKRGGGAEWEIAVVRVGGEGWGQGVGVGVRVRLGVRLRPGGARLTGRDAARRVAAVRLAAQARAGVACRHERCCLLVADGCNDR